MSYKGGSAEAETQHTKSGEVQRSGDKHPLQGLRIAHFSSGCVDEPMKG